MLEWEAIRYGNGTDELTEEKASRLAHVARRSAFAGEDGEGVLQHGRAALKARGYVGVVASGDCALEVLPKIDTGTTSQDDAFGNIRRQLVHMLAVAFDLKIDVAQVTSLAWQQETLLEIIIGVFVRKIGDALGKGRPRRYVGRREDLPHLRGRLDVTRQFSVLLADPSRLACCYEELNPDIALNRIVNAAIRNLLRVSRTTRNQQLLRQMALAYADVAVVPVRALKWGEVQFDRTNEHWREVVRLSRLLLGDRHQNTSSGYNDGFSLLFDMAKLFEKYVARSLLCATLPHGYSVELQQGGFHCLKDERGKGLFPTKPDVLVKRGDDVVQIIDTKWKRLGAHPKAAIGEVGQNDIYQMLAYGRLYGCPRLTLLYPHHGGIGRPEGLLEQLSVNNSDHKLEVASIDICKTEDIGRRLVALSWPKVS